MGTSLQFVDPGMWASSARICMTYIARHAAEIDLFIFTRSNRTKLCPYVRRSIYFNFASTAVGICY